MSIALSVSDKGSHLNCGTLSCSRQEKLVNTPFFYSVVFILYFWLFFSAKGGYYAMYLLQITPACLVTVG